MKTKRYGTIRRIAGIVQAALVLGLPFVEIGGNSALRFDIASLTLLFFGAVLPMNEFFIVLVAVIFVALVMVLLTNIFGRIWCGWACPQTVLSDFTAFVERSSMGKIRVRVGAYAVVLAVSALVSADLIWYFVSPYEFSRRLYAGELGPILWGAWIVLTSIMFLNFSFLRRSFCATVCPYAKLQSVLFDDRTLVIAFDERRSAECMDCGACAKVCPVGVDIRGGLNAACIGCAMCIDACGRVMRGRRRSSLVGYFFGTPGARSSGIRYSILLIGIAALVFCLLLAYLLATRSPFDVMMLRDFKMPPGSTAVGDQFSRYVLAIDNLTLHPLTLRITAGVESGAAVLKVNPEYVVLKPSENRKVPIRVTLQSGTFNPSEFIKIRVRNEDGTVREMDVRSGLTFPEGMP